MKFKALAGLIAALMLLTSLISCGGAANKNADNADKNEAQAAEEQLDSDKVYSDAENDNATPNALSEENSAGGYDVVYNLNSTSAKKVLASNGATGYKILSLLTESESLDAINGFASALKEKTGAEFAVITDASSIGGKQIVIGMAEDLKKHIGDFAFKSYTGASATVSGDTVYISTASLDALPLIFEHFFSQVELAEGGDFAVSSSLKIASDVCAITESLPVFTMATETPPTFSTSGTSSSPTNKGTYNAGNGNYQMTYLNVYSVNVRNYNSSLISAGYTLKQHNVINSNYFYTFAKGDTMVHINWFATLKQYSIIYGPKNLFPGLEPVTNYTKLVTPSISQMALYNTGQSNVIQLEDGSFIVIDGGRSKKSDETANHDAEILYNFLVEKKPASHAKPKVVWMFTHAHADHVNLAKYDFFPTYKGKIELEYVCMNFPDFSVLKDYVPSGGEWDEGTAYSAFTTSINALTTAINTNFPNTPIYTVHSGDVLYFPGCEVEILSTHEDFYLDGFANTNDTSIAFVVKMSGRRFMVYGDTTARVNDLIYERYGNYLKVDILQVSHHGVNAFMSLDLVATNDPDICLWPVRNAILTSTRVTSSDAYTWLRADSGDEGQRARTHYNQDYTVTVSIPDMTITEKQWYSGGKSDSLTGRTYKG